MFLTNPAIIKGIVKEPLLDIIGNYANLPAVTLGALPPTWSLWAWPGTSIRHRPPVVATERESVATAGFGFEVFPTKDKIIGAAVTTSPHFDPVGGGNLHPPSTY